MKHQIEIIVDEMIKSEHNVGYPFLPFLQNCPL